jgi:predicted ATPase
VQEPVLDKSVFGGKSELEADAYNLAIVLEKILGDEDDRRKLANLVKDALPFADGLETERLRDGTLFFNLRERYASSPVPAVFLSDGTIDIISLIIILYFERKPLVIIEELERNLHPSLMSRIVEYLEDATRAKQIIVTTHNPEIVRHVEPGKLILVSRDASGFSRVVRPVDTSEVQQFLRDEITIQDLYLHNLLGAR